jgi:hypothetical protein
MHCSRIKELHFLYLVGEVGKEALLMVSLEWMMHIVGGDRMLLVVSINYFSKYLE